MTSKLLPRPIRLRLAALLVSTAVASSVVLVSTAAPGTAQPPSDRDVRTSSSSPTATETECAMTRTGEYQRATPEDVGLDSALVKKALNYWTMNGAETAKVFRHGCLVGEGALDKAFDRVPRLNWSQSKTVQTLIAGVAEHQGLIDRDDTLDEYLPPGLGDAEHRAVTLRQVMNMTTGYEMNWVRGLNVAGDISRVREDMARPMAHEPGTYFEYDQDTPSLLTYVVQRAIWEQVDPKLDYQDWAQKNFFNKLGIPKSAWFWSRDRSGNTHGYSGLFLRPLEFGRIGELMLDRGTYQGVEIIDPGFIEQLHTGTEANCAYGFMAWLNSCDKGETQVNASIFARKEADPSGPLIASAPTDMYYTWGYHGQHIFVIPSLDMVVTRSGELPPDTISRLLHVDPEAVIAGSPNEAYHTFFRYLMKSVGDMPEDVEIVDPDGTFSTDPSLNVDPDSLIFPLDSAAGTYLGVGPSAPVGCTVLGCVGEPNDGHKWIYTVPRVVPGILGVERRPNG